MKKIHPLANLLSQPIDGCLAFLGASAVVYLFFPPTYSLAGPDMTFIGLLLIQLIVTLLGLNRPGLILTGAGLWRTNILKKRLIAYLRRYSICMFLLSIDLLGGYLFYFTNNSQLVSIGVSLKTICFFTYAGYLLIFILSLIFGNARSLHDRLEGSLCPFPTE